MEEKINSFGNHNNLIILCKKCYEMKIYLIPMFSINSKTFNIEFKCTNSHILEEQDILYLEFNDSLNHFTCEEHYYIFCAWCEECKKNKCFLCIGEELNKKHEYKMFMDIIPDYQMKNIFEWKIKKLKKLYYEYNLYCPNLIKEINKLQKIFIYFDISFNLFYKYKIQNYQTINNIILNFKDFDTEFDYFERIFYENKYKSFFKTVFNKKEDEINLKIFANQEISENQNIKIIPLTQDDEFYDKDKRKIKYFCLFNSCSKNFYIYDTKGKIINTLNLKGILEKQKIDFLENRFIPQLNNIEIIQYDNDILLFFSNIKFVFVFFSEAFRKYEIKNGVNFGCFAGGKIDNLKLMKINKNDTCLLLNGNLYRINFDNNYSKIILNNLLNKKNEEFILSAIPIDYKDNNIIIKKIICFSDNKMPPENIIYDDQYYNKYPIPMVDESSLNFSNNSKKKKKDINHEYRLSIYSNDLNDKENIKIDSKYNKYFYDMFIIELNFNTINNMLLSLFFPII